MADIKEIVRPDPGPNRITILGTCSGTEPFEGRNHCAFSVTWDGKVYWFDAGEACSITGYLMGVELRSVRAVFISHPHIDHIGGLLNLFRNIRKLGNRRKDGRTEPIDLFMPDPVTWPAIRTLLQETRENSAGMDLPVVEHREHDGLTFEENGIRVSMLHTNHLPPFSDGSFRSFGYRIEAGGQRIAFTGDFRNIAELAPILSDADVILAETGHRTPEVLCRELLDEGIVPGHLMLIHHGREILYQGESAVDKAREFYPGRITVLSDRDEYLFEPDGLRKRDGTY